jgi:hypothetical protein
VLPAHAFASADQESIMMDDTQLIYAPPAHVADTLRQIASLGVDRIKVSLVWSLVAPNVTSRQRPAFDATNPAAYPDSAWARYDTVVRYASQLGIKVYFQFSPPSPVWARAHLTTAQGPPLGRAPILSEFRNFVIAAGIRYSGSYVVATPPAPPPPPPPTLLGIPLGGSPASTGSPSPSAPLPRVDYWSIWNEPNERSWLNPWWRRLGRGRSLIQPSLYRGIVDAGWSGLQATGHGRDTILVGETANRGIWAPLPFVQALYCVGANGRPLRRGAATYVGCPRSGNPAAFATQHPGLFHATGFAHHPYSFDVPPSRPYPDRTFVTLYNMGALERLLTKIYSSYGQLRGGGVALYLSEWGYKTNPPNPFVHTSLPEQAQYLNDGEFMTWSNPWVRSLAQFLLIDDRPKAQTAVGSRDYWSSYQTGLVNLSGVPKPAYEAFRIPMWLPRARHGSHVTVWAQLRPADHTTIQYGVVQYQRRGTQDWSQIRELQTGSPRGFVVAHVSLPAPGLVRVAWLDPANGVVYYSRVVQVH